MKVKARTFSGGYRFKSFAGQPNEELVEAGIPEKVVIPLAQGVPPTVKPGEAVKAGQIIGIDDDSISNPVHSTVNGIVEEITTIGSPSARKDGRRKRHGDAGTRRHGDSPRRLLAPSPCLR